MSEPLDLNQLAQKIKQWGLELGFQQVGITDTDLSESEPKLQAWLDKQYHGEMDWMARHGMLRARPHELLPGTLRVISVRMNYLPANAAFASTLKPAASGHLPVSLFLRTRTCLQKIQSVSCVRDGGVMREPCVR